MNSPTPAQVKRLIQSIGLSSAKIAKLVGVSDGRQVRRWKSGESKMSYATWMLLNNIEKQHASR